MTIKIQGSLKEQGVHNGMSTTQFGRLFKRCAEEQQSFQAALDAGLFPFWTRTDEENLKAVKDWRTPLDKASRLIIVCSPMICMALQGIDTPYSIDWVCSIADTCADDAFKNSAVIFLSGDSWIDVWMEHHIDYLEESALSVWYCLGDGLDTSVPEGLSSKVQRLEETGIADERFVLFSTLGLALRRDVESALEGIKRGVKWIQEKGIWQNPSALLSVVTAGLEHSPQFETLLTPGSKYALLLRWSCSIAGRIQTNIRVHQGAPSKEHIALIEHGIVGDEGIFNKLHTTPKQLVILVREEEDDVNGASSLAQSQHAQSMMVESWLSEVQVPYVVWSVPAGWNSADHLSFQVQWMHRSLLSVAMSEQDPLSYDGGDSWRETSTKLWNRLRSNLSTSK